MLIYLFTLFTLIYLVSFGSQAVLYVGGGFARISKGEFLALPIDYNSQGSVGEAMTILLPGTGIKNESGIPLTSFTSSPNL